MGGHGLDGGGQSRDGGSPESPTRENPGAILVTKYKGFLCNLFCSWNSRGILYFELWGMMS